MNKKILSAFLAVIILITVIPSVSASANDFDIRDGVLMSYRGNSAHVVIPNGVTKIQMGAFAAKTTIVSVVFPNTLTEIGSSSFGGCTSLKSIELPNSVTQIGANAFYNCTSLETVVLSANIATIGEWAFADCTSLKSIVIPASIKSIGDRAFRNCTSLSSVTLPTTTFVLGEDVFLNTPWLATNPDLTGNKADAQDIAAKYTLIEGKNESGATVVTGLIIADGVTSFSIRNGFVLDGIHISRESFNFLESVTIPGSVNSIEANAFQRRWRLTEVIMHEGVQEIGRAAFNECTNLKRVVLPDSVTQIRASAFWGCTSLSEIKLPSGLLEIGEHAFRETKIKNVVIPNGAVAIGHNAFLHCEDLTDITIPPSVVSLGSISDGTCAFGALGATSIYDTPAMKERFSKLTIHGVPGSVAEQYAKEMGARFGTKFNPIDIGGVHIVTQTPNTAVAKKFNTLKAEIEKKYSIIIELDVNFYSEYADGVQVLYQIDEYFSLIPSQLHNALVAHFKAKGQTIRFTEAEDLGGYQGTYGHQTATINILVWNAEVFYHEYGHMVHYAAADKYGMTRFINEWTELHGVPYSNVYPDNAYEDIADTFMMMTLDQIWIRWGIANNEIKAELYPKEAYFNRVASAMFNIDSIFSPHYLPQTPSSWAVDAVDRAFEGGGYVNAATGILGGDANNPLLFQSSINRAEFCFYMLNMLDNAYFKKHGKTLTRKDSTHGVMLLDTASGEYVYVNEFMPKPLVYFDDCPRDESVAIMAWYGIVTGVGWTEFNPRGSLTREQAAVILYRASTLLGLADTGSLPSSPADAASISSWAKEAVAWVMRNGIMSGTGGNNFSPQGTFSYEQAIVTLVRVFDSVQK